jgi:hypothetical protein
MIMTIRKGTSSDRTPVSHRHHHQTTRRLNLSVFCPTPSTALSSLCRPLNVQRTKAPYKASLLLAIPIPSRFGLMITRAVATVRPPQGTCGAARSTDGTPISHHHRRRQTIRRLIISFILCLPLHQPSSSSGVSSRADVVLLSSQGHPIWREERRPFGCATAARWWSHSTFCVTSMIQKKEEKQKPRPT